MSEIVSIQIDGQEMRARTGQSILEAAEAGGVYIPRLCHRKGLAPYGACRVCMVRANGRPVASCTEPVSAGMVIESETDEILAWRRAVVEMLFVEGNHFCMICERSGDCELQAVAYRLGIAGVRYPYLWPRREVDATHPGVVLDRNRCILCARCIRASREIDGKHALGFTGRGACKSVIPDGVAGLAGSGLETRDEAVEACPVGAILRKQGAYATPVGKRRFDEHPIGERPHPRDTPSAGPGEML